MKMSTLFKTAGPLTFLALALGAVIANDEAAIKPLKILLVAGGCCHDYAKQKDILKYGLEERLHAEVTVEYSPDTTPKAKFKIYESDQWAEGYDLVIHDECSAAVTDKAYVGRILAAHKQGTPAVNLHCAMHSYRWDNFQKPVEKGGDNAAWFEMIGLQSSRHGPKAPIDVTYTDEKNPITKGFENWTTVDEELYNNVLVFDSAKVLANGKQMTKPRRKKGQKPDPNAKPTEENAAVVWTNEYGPNKTKIFSTSLGHFNETVADDRYLDLLARGLLWATGHLNEDGTVTGGYRK